MKEHFIWDHFSDQPHVIKDKKFKKNARKKYWIDYILVFFTALFVLPISFLVMFFFKKKPISGDEIYGICVNLDKGNEQILLAKELGVKNICIRLPLSDMKNLDKYYDFAKKFDDKNILLTILQDRKNIEDLSLFKKNLEEIFLKFDNFVYEYQIGNAINRLKWGFFSIKEFLDFYQVAYDLKRKKFPHFSLVAPSVIDFEYHHNARAFFNFYPYKFDITNALLYVDRRGSPYNKQYLFFDLKNKINLLYAMTKLSLKASSDIYITETNYPIKNTAPYAPTSEKECVSCEEYVLFLKEYFDIAKKSGKIKKIFWHQLIAPGYGLVDNRDGKIVKLPQFYAYKEMIENARNS